MHRVFAILLFVVLLATTIFGHVLAQGRVSARMIDVERQRLEELKAKLETTLLDQKGDRYKQAQERWDKINAVQKQIDELDRDPENYFYKR
jgi:hypothetical protein